MTMDFDSVLAPMTRAEFLNGYWDKAFVRIPGIQGRFSHLLGWDELDAILEQHRLTPPRLKLFQNGQAIDPQRFLTAPRFGVPRLDSGGLALCLAQGATLILDDVQEVAPRIQALMHVFQDALHTDAFANLYASWHGDNAFDLHWDAQSSVIVQLAGRKRWQVFEPTRLNPLEGEAEPPPRPTGAPAWDGMMEDGDTLYIPRGWWHVAFPAGEPSLHVTISLTPPTAVDFLGWTIARLRTRPEVRANLVALRGPAALAAQVKRLRQLLDEMLVADTAAEFLREWEANIRPSPHIRLQAMARQFAPATETSLVRLAALHRLFLVAKDSGFEFKAAGRLWAVPAELAPALAQLSNTRDIALAELAAQLPGPAAAADLYRAIGVLARAGVVLVQNG